MVYLWRFYCIYWHIFCSVIRYMFDASHLSCRYTFSCIWRRPGNITPKSPSPTNKFSNHQSPRSKIANHQSPGNNPLFNNASPGIKIINGTWRGINWVKWRWSEIVFPGRIEVSLEHWVYCSLTVLIKDFIVMTHDTFTNIISICIIHCR